MYIYRFNYLSAYLKGYLGLGDPIGVYEEYRRILGSPVRVVENLGFRIPGLGFRILGFRAYWCEISQIIEGSLPK